MSLPVQLLKHVLAQTHIILRMQVKRVAVLVSKMSHCLYDLLIRHRSGEANAELWYSSISALGKGM